MAGVREDLEAFTAELFDGFFRADQRRWGQVYVRGLLLDGRRKSVEPMAARLGEDGNRQALARVSRMRACTCRAQAQTRSIVGDGRTGPDRLQLQPGRRRFDAGRQQRVWQFVQRLAQQ